MPYIVPMDLLCLCVVFIMLMASFLGRVCSLSHAGEVASNSG